MRERMPSRVSSVQKYKMAGYDTAQSLDRPHHRSVLYSSVFPLFFFAALRFPNRATATPQRPTSDVVLSSAFSPIINLTLAETLEAFAEGSPADLEQWRKRERR